MILCEIDQDIRAKLVSEHIPLFNRRLPGLQTYLVSSLRELMSQRVGS